MIDNFLNRKIVVVHVDKGITTGLLYRYDRYHRNLYIIFAKESMCSIPFHSCKEIVLEQEWYNRKLNYILEL